MSPLIRDKRSLGIYLFTVFCFVLYAIVLQRTVGRVEDNTDSVVQQRLESCLNGIVILKAFNEQQRALIEITVNRRDLPPKVKEQYVKAYTGAIFEPLPSCEQQRKRLNEEKENNK